MCYFLFQNLSLCTNNVYHVSWPTNKLKPLLISLPTAAGIELFGKSVHQSSLGAGGIPRRAIDGNVNSNYNGDKSCSHTCK